MKSHSNNASLTTPHYFDDAFVMIATFSLVHTVYGTTYHSEEVVTRADTGLCEHGWLWALLVSRARSSATSACQRTLFDLFSRGLACLRDDFTLLAHANAAIKSLNCAVLLDFFHAFESIVELHIASVYMRPRISSTFRGWSLQYLKAHGVKDIQKVSRQFRTRFPSVHSPRRLISDFITDGADGTKAFPLAAIPHSTTADLKLKIEQKLRRDLECIETCCLQEVEEALARHEFFSNAESARERISLLGDIQACVSALMLIQIATCWNVGSVLELSSESIRKTDEGDFEIQGFKSKTDDATPSVLLKKNDAAHAAILFLMRRCTLLETIFPVSKPQGQLWISAFAAVINKKLKLYVGWPMAARKFQEKYALPRFSLEQLRVQCLAIASTGKGGIEAARRFAGHASISTTANYLDQLIFARIDAAGNLEFQRRLEESVSYRTKATLTDHEMQRDLLYSIGDGSSCADPSRPPNLNYLEFGMCGGKRCHVDGGCVNRRIFIDEARIEELVRSERYYISDWRLLLDENEEAFRAYHLPSIIFNVAMVRIIGRGPFRTFLKDAQARINAEATNAQG